MGFFDSIGNWVKDNGARIGSDVLTGGLAENYWLPNSVKGQGVLDKASGGNLSASKDQSNSAAGQFNDISTPDLPGVNPLPQGQTAYNNIDPTSRNAQLSALGQFQNIANDNGMTPEDKAFLNQVNQQNNTLEQGHRDALLQGYQNRGTANSGTELAAQLANQQGAAASTYSQGLNAQAQAQARQTAALQSVGQLGGSIYNEDAGKAKAQDAINQFNAGNSNQAIYYNAGLPQQNFNNQLSLASDRANAYNKQAANSAQQGGVYLDAVGGAIKTAGQVAGAAAGAGFAPNAPGGGTATSGTAGAGDYGTNASSAQALTQQNDPYAYYSTANKNQQK